MDASPTREREAKRACKVDLRNIPTTMQIPQNMQPLLTPQPQPQPMDILSVPAPTTIVDNRLTLSLPEWHPMTKKALATRNPEAAMENVKNITKATADADFIREGQSLTKDNLTKLCLEEEVEDDCYTTFFSVEIKYGQLINESNTEEIVRECLTEFIPREARAMHKVDLDQVNIEAATMMLTFRTQESRHLAVTTMMEKTKGQIVVNQGTRVINESACDRKVIIMGAPADLPSSCIEDNWTGTYLVCKFPTIITCSPSKLKNLNRKLANRCTSFSWTPETTWLESSMTPEGKLRAACVSSQTQPAVKCALNSLDGQHQNLPTPE